MKILLTNDDGVISAGIQTLAKILADKGKLAAVVAPDRERSGMGHAITVTKPVRVHLMERGVFPESAPAYSCDGTPTDCVTIGLDLLFPHVDFVVSGINQGPNLGDDVTYSGTVCAAMEGVILGRPSLAVSLACEPTDSAKHNTTAAVATMAVLGYLETHPLPEGILLNVNVPNKPLAEIKGFKLTRRGIRRYTEKFTCMKDPHGKDCYWIAGKIEDVLEEGTDVTAVAQGYISVTPIHMDMTEYSMLESMNADGVEVKLGAAIGKK